MSANLYLTFLYLGIKLSISRMIFHMMKRSSDECVRTQACQLRLHLRQIKYEKGM